MNIIIDCAKAVWAEAIIIRSNGRTWARESRLAQQWYIGVATMAAEQVAAGARATEDAIINLAEMIWTRQRLLSCVDAETLAGEGDGTRDWYCRAARAALTFLDQRRAGR